MATTNLTIPNELLTTTAFNYAKEIRTSHHRPYKAVDHMLSVGLRKEEGGERFIVAFDFAEHSIPTRMQSGYESFANSMTPVGTPGHDLWAYVVQPTYFSDLDEMKNRGKAKMLDQWKIRVKNVDDAMRRSLSQAFFKGAAATGTWPGVFGWEDFNTANGADNNTGFLEATASGTNTIHNISRASFTLASGHFMFHNLFFDALNAASTNLLIGMYGFVPILNLRLGAINPNDYKGYFTVEALGNIKRALRAFEQYVAIGPLDDAARPATMFNNIELFSEELPNLGTATTAAPWSGVLINWGTGMKFVGQSGLIFDSKPVVDIPGTIARVRVTRVAGQFECGLPGTHALLTKAQTW